MGTGKGNVMYSIQWRPAQRFVTFGISLRQIHRTPPHIQEADLLQIFAQEIALARAGRLPPRREWGTPEEIQRLYRPEKVPDTVIAGIIGVPESNRREECAEFLNVLNEIYLKQMLARYGQTA